VLNRFNKVFNPRRFAFARRRRGYTKTALAQKLRIDLRTAVAYEAGEYLPSEEILESAALILKFPRDFFCGEELDEPSPEIVSFRALTKMTAKQREMAVTQGALAMHFAKWLEKRFELPGNSLPDLSREANPEIAAESLRQAWGLGQLPIRNVLHLLEAQGVRVFSLAIDAREVDAFSVWQGDVPFVFLNGNKSSEHSRFDAAHELGHLVLHKHGGPRGRKAELEANSFASAFLMPRGSVLAYPPRFPTIQELCRLKKVWTVSVSALAYRLHELRLLSDWHYRRLCIEMSKRGFRHNEPDEAPRETSLILPQLLNSLYQDDGMTRSAIAADLGISLHELESLVFSFVLTTIDEGRHEDNGLVTTSPLLRRIK